MGCAMAIGEALGSIWAVFRVRFVRRGGRAAARLVFSELLRVVAKGKHDGYGEENHPTPAHLRIEYDDLEIGAT
jgi:hypothetical protein